MPGAIIPDDWDGSTFECVRIEWPSSALWEAILLGQITDPSTPGYWDALTGNPDDAARSVQDAYRLTAPALFTTECDDIPGIPVPTFKVTQTTSQVLAAATWTTVDWDVLTWNENDPEFALSLNGQSIQSDNLKGLWHYDVFLRVEEPINTCEIRAVYTGAGGVIAVSGSTGGDPTLSFDWLWTETDEEIEIQMWSFLANTIRNDIHHCQWVGYYVGPTEVL